MKALLLALAIMARSGDWTQAALSLTAAACVEELSQGELERFHSYSQHPLDLNSASKSKLLSCGLLTPYQVAVLLDYRATNGPIASYTELSALDGFGVDTAAALQSFTTLQVTSLGPPKRAQTEGLARWCGGAQFKAKLKTETACGFGCALAGVYDGSPSIGSANVSMDFSVKTKLPLRIILGDYNLRIGQGLALWSGFSLSGISTPEAIIRTNANGIAPSNSLSSEGHLRGAAASYELGNWTLNAAWHQTGLFVLNAKALRRRSTYSFTVLSENGTLKAGADYIFTPGKVTWFGEAGLSGSQPTPDALVGACWNIAYRHKLLGSAQWVNGAPGCNLGYRYKSLGLTAGLGPKQQRAIVQFSPSLEISPQTSVGGMLKGAVKYRPADKTPLRIETRAEASVNAYGAIAKFRADYVCCKEWAVHLGVELGYKHEGERKWSAYGRMGVFRVDNWADRIYVYERDVPSAFTVPAYYGRGVAWGVVASYGSVSMRIGGTLYPNGEKEDKFAMRVQYSFR